jgi:fructuronate reductase
MKKQLDYSTLSDCSTPTITPNYNPKAHGCGIVHIGIGAFHKAHQAVYTDDVLNLHGGDWRITAVSLRNTTARDQLSPQGGLYTVVEKMDDSVTCRVIGAISQVLVAPENPAAVIIELASPSTKIVTLTITEKGYCQVKGELDLQNVQIQRDIQQPESPTTMPGFIVAACLLRMHNKQSGITVVSCDNLPHNGDITRRVVIGFAEKINHELANWIRDNISFCSTMVDRIVPATTELDIIDTSNYIGLNDRATVICEPFRQWVIEDNFCTDRPRWEDAGALIVSDVLPFEKMKLRLLNGSHSALAYLGFLSGHSFIHEAIADKNIHALIEHLMNQEITPTLSIPENFQIEQYKKTIRARFANSQVPYKTTQVASDGSQKIPQRLLAAAAELIAQQTYPKVIPLLIAAWFRYLEGVNEQGESYEINDPKAPLLVAIAFENRFNSHLQISKLVDCLGVFPSTLTASQQFMADIEFWLNVIHSKGIAHSIQQCIADL